MLSAAAKEPAGVWFGQGLGMLGIEPGTGEVPGSPAFTNDAGKIYG